jgi:histidine triad (HIT) family protein
MLDRNQAARGHVLVIGKQHVAAWDELDEPTVMEMAALARRWAARLREALGVRAYNLLVNCGPDAGQDVMHAHLHVTPRVAGDGYYMFGGKQEVLAAADMEAIASTLRARA